MIDTAAPALTLADFVRMLRRRKGRMLLCFTLVVAATLALTAFAKRTYVSEAKLLLRLGRENLGLDPTGALGQQPRVSRPQTREDEISTVIDVLGSHAVRERVVDALGVETILAGSGSAGGNSSVNVSASAPSVTSQVRDAVFGAATPREKALDLLEKQLSVTASKMSNVVTISYEAPSPELAQQVTQEVVDTYLDLHTRLHRTAGAADFFEAQTSSLQAELHNAERLRRDLLSQAGVTSMQERKRLLDQRVAALEDKTLAVRADLAASQAMVKSLQDRLAALPPEHVTERVIGFPNVALDGMRQRLYELQLKEQELRSRYTEESKPVQNIMREVGEAAKLLATEETKRSQVKTAINNTYEALRLALHTEEARASSLRSQAEELDQQLAAARGQIEPLNEKEMQAARLQREIEVLDNQYRQSQDTLRQALVDHELETKRISNVAIAEAPTLESKPVSPRRLLYFALGGVAAIALSLGVGLASELFDPTLRSVDDVERTLGAPALICIPRFNSRRLHSFSKENGNGHK